MINEDDFKFLYVSDCEYEKLVLEMYYKNSYIGLLNQDNGLEDLKLELAEQKISMKVFEMVLKKAKQKLENDKSRDKDGKHIDEVDFNLKPEGKTDKTGGHNLNVK
ncbi:hypothetical protein [Sulfurospirillum sp. hDNRA2]|uniref:hypothetical protein n=1 Tax=Sulfurospirillum sp. hDNRA2 TaxID=3237298 RepID=UPI0020B8CD57|nr:hypothetical protein [Sulfurospirillum sp. DNRA8]MCP3650820.1 hypothetical protein [Sulfurospirillum sp. DNRA8]MCR1809665.1 hypothetical protein [Sulfurospirillum sp. DNRA8]